MSHPVCPRRSRRGLARRGGATCSSRRHAAGGRRRAAERASRPRSRRCSCPGAAPPSAPRSSRSSPSATRRRLQVRGDPRRHLATGRAARTAHGARQPRDLDRSVPVQAAARRRRRRTRSTTSSTPRSASSSSARAARSSSRRQGHRHADEASSASARTSWRPTDGFEDRPLLFTNEEGIDWVSRTSRHCTRLDNEESSRVPPARARSAPSSPTTSRRRQTADLGHGPPQPREQRRHPGLRHPGPALGRRLVRRAPAAVAGLRVHRRRTRTPSGTTRASSGRSCRRRVRRDQRLLRLPDRRLDDRASAATSSRSRRRSRRARTRTAPT